MFHPVLCISDTWGSSSSPHTNIHFLCDFIVLCLSISSFFSGPRLAYTLVNCFFFFSFLSDARLFVPPVSAFKTQRGSFSHFSSHQFPAFFPSSPPFSLMYKIGATPLPSLPPPPKTPPPPPLCVIHNGPSASLHVSHMGGTPVFFNTFLIPPFDAPLVHHNLYWLLNKIKGLVLAASRLCYRKMHFLYQSLRPHPPTHTLVCLFWHESGPVCEPCLLQVTPH